MFENFGDARSKQTVTPKGGKATQTAKSWKHDELGNVEERVLAAVEALGLEERPNVVENVEGMIADYQSSRGTVPSCGISVYERKVTARGPEAIAALS